MKYTDVLINDVLEESEKLGKTLKKICEERKLNYDSVKNRVAKVKKVRASFELDKKKEETIIPPIPEHFKQLQDQLEDNSSPSMIDQEIKGMRDLKRNERSEALALKSAIRKKLVDKDGRVSSELKVADIKTLTSSLATLQDILYRSFAMVKDSNLGNLGNNDKKDDIIKVVFIDSSTPEPENSQKVDSDLKSQTDSRMDINQNIVEINTEQKEQISNQESMVIEA